MASALAKLQAEYVCRKKKDFSAVPESLKADVLEICKQKCPERVEDV